jgi:S-formylglutathione hydrolase FrmB
MKPTLRTKLKPRALLLITLLLFSFTVYGQGTSATRVETIQFKSKLTGKTLPYSVVLPPDYEQRKRKDQSGYPVLYLLHGLTGHYSDWLAKTKLREYAAQYRLIIVTPEGNDGWYTDSAIVAADKYETYILQELMPDVESRFRALKNRQGRAIAGLSMGGYGALKFGVKYPDKFIFAASMSGALDVATRPESYLRFKWEAMRVSVEQTFGPPDNPTRADNDLYKLFRNLPAERLASLPFIYLDCGTEDGLVAPNRELATILLERKIPHEFRQLPGKHNWEYWGAQVQEVLKMAAQKMTLSKQRVAFIEDKPLYFLGLSTMGTLSREKILN